MVKIKKIILMTLKCYDFPNIFKNVVGEVNLTRKMPCQNKTQLIEMNVNFLTKTQNVDSNEIASIGRIKTTKTNGLNVCSSIKVLQRRSQMKTMDHFYPQENLIAGGSTSFNTHTNQGQNKTHTNLHNKQNNNKKTNIKQKFIQIKTEGNQRSNSSLEQITERKIFRIRTSMELSKDGKTTHLNKDMQKSSKLNKKVFGKDQIFDEEQKQANSNVFQLSKSQEQKLSKNKRKIASNTKNISSNKKNFLNQQELKEKHILDEDQDIREVQIGSFCLKKKDTFESNESKTNIKGEFKSKKRVNFESSVKGSEKSSGNGSQKSIGRKEDLKKSNFNSTRKGKQQNSDDQSCISILVGSLTSIITNTICNESNEENLNRKGTNRMTFKIGYDKQKSLKRQFTLKNVNLPKAELQKLYQSEKQLPVNQHSQKLRTYQVEAEINPKKLHDLPLKDHLRVTNLQKTSIKRKQKRLSTKILESERKINFFIGGSEKSTHFQRNTTNRKQVKGSCRTFRAHLQTESAFNELNNFHKYLESKDLEDDDAPILRQIYQNLGFQSEIRNGLHSTKNYLNFRKENLMIDMSLRLVKKVSILKQKHI